MPDANPTVEKKSFPAKAFLFARVFFLAAAVPHLLRAKLSKVAAFLEPGTPPSPAVDPMTVKRIAAYVETSIRRGRPLVRPGCLTRGVTRYYFLRRAGLDVTLHFGMGQIGGEFVGHCWLVKDGTPFLENQDVAAYVVTYRISPKGGEPVVNGVPEPSASESSASVAGLANT